MKSASVIETAVPKGLNPGAYDVTVLNSRGQKATLTKGYAVTGGVQAKEGCGCNSAGADVLGLIALALTMVRWRTRSSGE